MEIYQLKWVQVKTKLNIKIHKSKFTSLKLKQPIPKV